MTKYAALIGPRVVDIYASTEDAMYDMQSFPEAWTLHIPTGMTLMNTLEGRTYKGVPLYVALW